MGKLIDKEKFQKTTQLLTAIARWDNEGGAGPDGPQEGSNMLAASRKKIARKAKKHSKVKTDDRPSIHN